MFIRDARPHDAVEIAAIYNHAVEHTTAVLNFSTVDAKNRMEWMAARQKAGYPVLVAVEGERVLGYAGFGDWRPFDGYRATVEHSVYVHHEARGRGLSYALMNPLIDRAVGCGKHVMLGAITAENTLSLHVHDRLGFTRTGHMREVGQKFGRWLDVIFMERRLDNRPAP